jgi:hypothetical protein
VRVVCLIWATGAIMPENTPHSASRQKRRVLASFEGKLAIFQRNGNEGSEHKWLVLSASRIAVLIPLLL